MFDNLMLLLYHDPCTYSSVFFRKSQFLTCAWIDIDISAPCLVEDELPLDRWTHSSYALKIKISQQIGGGGIIIL